MPRPRRFTDEKEAEILQRFELGKMHTIKALCADYDVRRSTLDAILFRARLRAKLAENDSVCELQK